MVPRPNNHQICGIRTGPFDLAVQCCGGAGISRDLPLADISESVRAFRIIDGADEERTIAREAFDEVNTEELDSLPRFEG